jgi:hypothetical protein
VIDGDAIDNFVRLPRTQIHYVGGLLYETSNCKRMRCTGWLDGMDGML